ncbi:unnamed protein product [Cyprideis torosa]|uniref:Replication protein A subunit n=1 Tax=Cyprideis torosa TaxID=163714 RepID=A0A7R8W5E0_9CRUS|nr:unnamed protein product [Cyprideis torosa]CAG0885163.1 unnamed protein product [Cyprideis torosa]
MNGTIEQLTVGAISKMMSGEHVTKPVLQILGIKPIAGTAQGQAPAQERYRLLVSDGEVYHTFAILATQLNYMISDKTLATNTVIQVDRFLCNVVAPKGNEAAKWAIKARVIKKMDIRHYSNSHGAGKFFSVDLTDSAGEIRATGFNNEVDRLYSLFEPDKVYVISRGNIKPARKEFNHLNCDYEINFNGDTTVSLAEIDPGDIPRVRFSFVAIDQIEALPKDKLIDTIGVCVNVGPAETLTSRSTNREFIKRNVELVDRSNCKIGLALWGETATNFNGTDNPIVAVKGAKVSDFNGRSLSVLNRTMIQINPDIDEAHRLQAWYTSEGCQQAPRSLTEQGRGGKSAPWKILGEVKALNIRVGQEEFFTCKASIMSIQRDNALYMACPGEMQIADFSDAAWVTAFSENAEKILDATSEELGVLKSNMETNADAFNRVFADVTLKTYVFKLATRMESYNVLYVQHWMRREVKEMSVVIRPVDSTTAVMLQMVLMVLKKEEELPKSRHVCSRFIVNNGKILFLILAHWYPGHFDDGCPDNIV